MNSEALERGALILEAIAAPSEHHRLCNTIRGGECDCYMRRYSGALAELDALLAEVARLEQERDIARTAHDRALAEFVKLEKERDEWKRAAECAPTSWADIYGREHERRTTAEDALAAARAREQRLASVIPGLLSYAIAAPTNEASERARDASVERARDALADQTAADEARA